MWVNTQSEIISKVLPPAVRLFLRTQVEQIEDLEMQLHGHDRQILRGYIPGVFLAVGRAIYQGLHLGKAQLRGENMAVITGGDRTDLQLAALETSTTCLILTGSISPDPLIEDLKTLLIQAYHGNLPLEVAVNGHGDVSLADLKLEPQPLSLFIAQGIVVKICLL